MDNRSTQLLKGTLDMCLLAFPFAESWARETSHRFSGGFTVILRWLVFDFRMPQRFRHFAVRRPSKGCSQKVWDDS